MDKQQEQEKINKDQKPKILCTCCKKIIENCSKLVHIKHQSKDSSRPVEPQIKIKSILKSTKPIQPSCYH
jgi:hypothetical protein